jgi:hypothetical protein
VQRSKTHHSWIAAWKDGGLRCAPPTLEEAGRRVAEWLHRERAFALKDLGAMRVENRRPADFVGFRVSRGGLTPGPKALRRLRWRLHRAENLDPKHLAACGRFAACGLRWAIDK